MDISLLREFQLDWRLAGIAERTATDYTKALVGLLTQHPVVVFAIFVVLEHPPRKINKARTLNTRDLRSSVI